jgi:hypothetical protein
MRRSSPVYDCKEVISPDLFTGGRKRLRLVLTGEDAISEAKVSIFLDRNRGTKLSTLGRSSSLVGCAAIIYEELLIVHLPVVVMEKIWPV